MSVKGRKWGYWGRRILMILILWGCVFYFMMHFLNFTDEKTGWSVSGTNMIYWDQIDGGLFVDLSHLQSKNAVLINLGSGKIEGEHQSKNRMYPASMTKMMTALLVIENTGDLDEKFSLSEDIFERLYNDNASMAGFWPGERVSVRDLVYGMLLSSGGEACVAAAEWLYGSESAFVEAMNQKAETLGMEDTRFTNTTGLHDKRHYTTVADMALLLQYALKDPRFREVFTSSIYTTQGSDMRPEGFTMQSRIYDYMGNGVFPEGEILGGKTGYTDEAGLCLASLARVGGQEYLLVTAGAEGNLYTEPYHVRDALEIYGKVLQ